MLNKGNIPIFGLLVVFTTLLAAASMVLSADVSIDEINMLETALPDSGTKFQGTATDKGPKRKLDLQDPPNLERKVTYDPESKMYTITETIGGKFYKSPVYMSFEEYQKYEAQKTRFDYWKQRSSESSLISPNGMVPKIYVNNQVFDRIFGGSKVDIRPQGTAELIFSGKFNRNDNPLLNESQRKTQQFDFDQKIQLNVTGNIGDKLKTSVNYNTEASFDFENPRRLCLSHE